MKNKKEKLKWFVFDQNNSGGRFVVNDKLDTRVFIQAKNAKEANYLAETLGIYFNGVEDETDCDCCGDRWYAQYDDTKGTDEPSLYGQKITKEELKEQKWNGSYGKRGIKVYSYGEI